MIYGVDYYPEHWQESEWENQIKLIKEGNFNTVRIGEFAWGLFEKKEGEFDFTILDKVISVLSDNNINIIIGTPTAAPPKWLVDKYDIVQRDKYGRAKNWGARRECCANNPDYISKSKIIVEEMVKHYKNYPNIIAWQIDNEFGCHGSTRCYCEHCRKAFANWLREKYKTIENLNEKWGTVFWSLGFESFDDIILPGYNSCENTYGDLWSHNPSLDIEYRRFASDSWVKFQKNQIDIIRKHTNIPITHNLMGHFSDIDAYKLSNDLDFVSWDNYPDNQWGTSEYEYVSMAHENMRGAKNKNFVVMEEQSGPAGWDVLGSTPRPGQLRLWTYQAIVHGAEGIVYFRFRTALFGMEQYWYGVLDHDGKPRRRYYELQKLGSELKKIEKYIINSNTQYQVLIVKSYDNSWANAIKRHAEKFDYENLLYSYYKANLDLNISAAVSAGNYEKYKAVYLPAYNIADEDEAEKVKNYVYNGGIVILTFRSGIRNIYNNMYPIAVPGVFAEIAGIEVEEFDALRKNNQITGKIKGTASLWCDIITPNSAQVISVYDKEYYKGKAAITVNKYGKGKVYYVGCDLDEQAMKQLAKMVAEEADIEYTIAPNNIEIVKRDKYIAILNYNEYDLDIPIRGYDLITESNFDGKIQAYGVVFLKN